MGQRLNIEIVDDNKALANCYYHWGAYTGSALDFTRIIVNAYYEAPETPSVALAVKLLAKTGAGVNGGELDRIAVDNSMCFKGIEFPAANNRNDGLIAVTEEGMEETRAWEEGRVTIDLGNETICFSVFCEYTEEEYLSEFDEDNDVPVDELPLCPYELSEVPFPAFGDLIQFVDAHPEGAISRDGDICHWIE